MMRHRRMQALALTLLLALPLMASAEQPPAGAYATAMERRALDEGMELRTELSFAWGGLPLLDAKTNEMLESLLGALTLTAARQGQASDGYLSLDVLLTGVSVLDISMQALGGVYYEQSNLLGGQTVAFTAEEFRTFAGRLSARSGGAIPAELGPVFPAVMRALGTAQTPIDTDTMDAAQVLIARWAGAALQQTEIQRPSVRLPGRYGLRAEVIEISRAEMLALVDAFSALLSENDALWQDAARAQAPEMDEAELADFAKDIAQAIRDLPDLARRLLPADMPPVIYRRVYGPDDALTARQLDITLPDGPRAQLEWAGDDAGTLPLFALFTLGESSLDVVITNENGVPQIGRSQTTQHNRLIAQLTYAEPGLQIDAVLTHSERIVSEAARERRTLRTDCRIASDALLGAGTQLVLTAQTTDTASGTPGKDYARRAETTLTVSGLDFDDASILTMDRRVTANDASPPAGPEMETVVHPAAMRDAELRAWLDGLEISLTQTAYTIMGRLPPEVAGYLLQLIL